jgi:flagellar hook-associated protein 3 FlgL
MINDNLQFQTRNRSVEMNDVQDQIASQSRLNKLRNDPAAAAHTTRYSSYLTRLNRFSDNLQTGISNYRMTEGHMRQAVDVLQEIRQIAVQGSTGTYSQEDTKQMARRVDELLGQLVATANAQNGDGTAVFGGDRSKTLPFRTIEGRIPGFGGTVVTDVEYTGSIGTKQTEISDGNYIELSIPGNQVFWAENQQIFSQVDASSYVAQQASTISIDGVDIPVSQGDNIYTIMSSINRSDAPVKARLDPVQNSLVLESTTPHQIWLADDQGEVLSDLGILRNPQAKPPQNLANDTRLYGGSLFDSVIRLRNELFQGDVIDIGGDSLRGLDTAMDNLLSNVSRVGARTERMEISFRRIEREIPDMTGRLSLESDVDMTEAITNLKTLEVAHKAALSTLARVVPTTLLDFLR